LIYYNILTSIIPQGMIAM